MRTASPRMLAEAVLDGASEDAPVRGRHLDQLCGTVVRELERAVTNGAGRVETVDEISLHPIDWPRARPEVVLSDHHGEFNQRVGYPGCQRPANARGSWKRLRQLARTDHDG